MAVDQARLQALVPVGQQILAAMAAKGFTDGFVMEMTTYTVLAGMKETSRPQAYNGVDDEGNAVLINENQDFLDDWKQNTADPAATKKSLHVLMDTFRILNRDEEGKNCCAVSKDGSKAAVVFKDFGGTGCYVAVQCAIKKKGVAADKQDESQKNAKGSAANAYNDALSVQDSFGDE